MGANCEVQSADVPARPETMTGPTVGSDATWLVRDAAKCPNSGAAPGTLHAAAAGLAECPYSKQQQHQPVSGASCLPWSGMCCWVCFWGCY